MAKKEGRMTVTRRKSILDQINEKGEVIITDLSEQFKVSEVTIRNDLEYLERKNLLIRARGGAIKVEQRVSADPAILIKSKVHITEKVAIGKLATKLIEEDDTIILDGGTTTAEIAKNLDRFSHLTIITNAINIVNLLIGKANIDLVVLGGTLRHNSMTLIGSLGENSLRNIFADKAFISTDGLDTQAGVFTPNIEEASLNRMMISNAKEIILVTDSSKFGRKSLAYICGIKEINIVITDKGISELDRKILEDSEVKVMIS